MASISTREKSTRKSARDRRGSSSKLPKQKTSQELKAKDRSTLELRKRISSRRPRFLRQETWRYGRIHKPWRKPKGVDSKMRKMVKGWPRLVKIGFGGPIRSRGLHPSGLRDVIIHNVKELQRLDPKTDAARISSNVGARKRTEILAKAKETGVKVLNPTGLKLKK
jgi:large subunit ribosomal protein L32e